jgi:hypothetical protein
MIVANSSIVKSPPYPHYTNNLEVCFLAKTTASAMSSTKKFSHGVPYPKGQQLHYHLLWLRETSVSSLATHENYLSQNHVCYKFVGIKLTKSLLNCLRIDSHAFTPVIFAIPLICSLRKRHKKCTKTPTTFLSL